VCISRSESFFDEIPHSLLLKLIRRKIDDERLVTLVCRSLKAGVIVDGKFERTGKDVRRVRPCPDALQYCAQ